MHVTTILTTIALTHVKTVIIAMEVHICDNNNASNLSNASNNNTNSNCNHARNAEKQVITVITAM